MAWANSGSTPCRCRCHHLSFAVPDELCWPRRSFTLMLPRSRSPWLQQHFRTRTSKLTGSVTSPFKHPSAGPVLTIPAQFRVLLTWTASTNDRKCRDASSFNPLSSKATTMTSAMTTPMQVRSHSGHSHHHHHDNAYLTSTNKSDAGVRITRIGLYVNLAMAIGKGIGGYVFHSQGNLSVMHDIPVIR